MTLATTLAPPKHKPWFECTKATCTNKFQAYHGKIGCLCHDCDNVTRPDTKAKALGEQHASTSISSNTH